MAGKELINKIRKKGICGTIKMIAVKWKKTERDLWNPPISRVRKDLIDRILRRVIPGLLFMRITLDITT